MSNLNVVLIIVLKYFILLEARYIDNDNNEGLISPHNSNNMKQIEMEQNKKLPHELFPNNVFFQIGTPESYTFHTVDHENDVVQHVQNQQTDESTINPKNPLLQNLFPQENVHANENPLVENTFQQPIENNINHENKPELTNINSENEGIVHDDNPFLQDFLQNKNKQTTTSKNQLTSQIISNGPEEVENSKNDADDAVVQKDNPFLQESFNNNNEKTTINNVERNTQNTITETATEPSSTKTKTSTSTMVPLTTTKKQKTTTIATKSVPIPEISFTTPMVYTLKPAIEEPKILYLSPKIKDIMKDNIVILAILFCSVAPGKGIFIRFVEEQYPTSSSYDFIIVGSGSAGSVLARRLSENPDWKILLLEVGKRPSIISDVPFLAPALQFTDYVWNYKMEKTPGVCLGMEELRCHWPRGRGLGGTTLINYMIYTRGHRQDFERWKAAGNPGWGYDDVLPYYLKSEDAHLENYDEGYHSRGGPLSVEDARWRSKIIDDFIKSTQDLGYPYVDYNGKYQTGVSYVQANTREGVRNSGYRAFIQPSEHRINLDIITEARVTRLLLNPSTKHVYGVEYVKNRQYQYVNCTKEVILSAGAFNSPQILMLSGVGPKSHLESIGIPVIQNLPVGKNLQDHITFLGMVFVHETGDHGLPNPKELTSVRTLLDWWKGGRGPLTSIGGVEGLAYFNTNTSRFNVGIPDMELIVLNGRFDENLIDILRQSLAVRREVFFEIFRRDLLGKPMTVVLPMHLKPHSVGHLELKSSNPYHWPKLYGNHLSDPENLDVKAFIAAIRFIKKIMTSHRFDQYNTKLMDAPVPGCHTLDFDSDEYWECAVRHISTTLHHQVGTCKMGPRKDKTSVVDHELRVHGLKGVRVADTSVIPFALNAHTNAPSYMIGEKTADLIKKQWCSAKYCSN